MKHLKEIFIFLVHLAWGAAIALINLFFFSGAVYVLNQ